MKKFILLIKLHILNEEHKFKMMNMTIKISMRVTAPDPPAGGGVRKFIRVRRDEADCTRQQRGTHINMLQTKAILNY